MTQISQKRLIASLALLIFLLYYFSGSWFRYCNDAYLYSDLIEVTPQISGFIKNIQIKDNQLVKKGDLLVEIDPTPFVFKLNQAKAQLGEAEEQLGLLESKKAEAEAQLKSVHAQLANASANLKRYQSLIKSGAISKQFFAQAATTEKVSQAQVELAEAQLASASKSILLQKNTIVATTNAVDIAQYELNQTKLYAPESGYINHLGVFQGDFVTTGKPLFGLLSNKNWRVIANYQSDVVTHLAPGDLVLMYISGYPFRVYLGRIESITRGVAREATPQNPALPYVEPITSWIRYPYRFPVRIKFNHPPQDLQLHRGADVRTLVL